MGYLVYKIVIKYSFNIFLTFIKCKRDQQEKQGRLVLSTTFEVSRDFFRSGNFSGALKMLYAVLKEMFKKEEWGEQDSNLRR